MFKKVKFMYKESIANVYKSVIDKISHIMKDAPYQTGLADSTSDLFGLVPPGMVINRTDVQPRGPLSHYPTLIAYPFFFPILQNGPLTHVQCHKDQQPLGLS